MNSEKEEKKKKSGDDLLSYSRFSIQGPYVCHLYCMGVIYGGEYGSVKDEWEWLQRNVIHVFTQIFPLS